MASDFGHLHLLTPTSYGEFVLTLFGLILLNDSDRCVESMLITFEDDLKLGGKPVALVFKKVLRSKKSRLNLNQQKNVHYALRL